MLLTKQFPKSFLSSKKINISYSRLKSIRTRFAPSPTGYLHLGGLRTALYNYLFARSKNGTFIFRLEDTDRTRFVPDAADKLQEDLGWVGLNPDEGPAQGGDFGPYVQSERKALYEKEVDRLLSNQSAYRCFCSEKRLKLLRDHALRHRQVPRYDNHCRHLSPQELRNKASDDIEPCIRFKLTNSEPFTDLVYGEINHAVHEIEGDPIILKKDGFPTYHLANVVDDVHMAISHVIRGVEWLQSTNKHVLIYKALGYPCPQFAHLPLLLNPDGSKLSKRQGDITVQSMRNNGIFPRAVINFIVSAGSGFSGERSLTRSLEELINEFDLSRVNPNSCSLPMDRLSEFNKAELCRLLENDENIPNLVKQIKTIVRNEYAPRYSEAFLDLDDNHIESILRWSTPRISTLKDLVRDDLMFLWMKPYNVTLPPECIAFLKEIMPALVNEEFTKQNLSLFLKCYSDSKDISFKTLMTVMRSALSGLKEGPGVAEMMEILGKKTSLERMQHAISFESEVCENKSM